MRPLTRACAPPASQRRTLVLVHLANMHGIAEVLAQDKVLNVESIANQKKRRWW